MIVTVKIPPKLQVKLDALASEAAGLNRNELVLPDYATFVECREVISSAVDHRAKRPYGGIYIDLANGTMSQATVGKGLLRG